MHIKIHIHDKMLYLCDSLDDDLNKLVHKPDTVFIDELDVHSTKTMLRELELPEIKTGIFYHADLQVLKKVFFKRFELFIAAGGYIQNEQQEVLLIFRRGFWDMPKGKLDAGESLEACAIREIQEETGLTATIQKPLITTYHTYEQGSHHILKESHWFYMEAKKDQQLIAQTEEDITEIQWVNKPDLVKYKSKAYPSIVDVWEAADSR